MPKIKIAPSILAANFSEMGRAIRNLEESGADLVHCDVMDGNFVPPITFGAQMVRQIRPLTRLPLDCHLMVLHPETHLEDFARAGADNITVHYEACELPKTLRKIKEMGMKASAVINPETPAEALFDSIGEADMLLLMSVRPGWGGQEFIPSTLEKIRVLREFCIKNGRADMDIQVDGGISFGNVRSVIEAGANVIVAGSAVFRSENMRLAVSRLRGE